MNKFIFISVLMVSAIGGFAAAQGMRGTGGGGMAGQPIDGTAIYPSSVTTTGDLTIGASGGDAKICLNGPTCTTNLQYAQGTSNFAIFHNNTAQISSNNVSLIQIWRDVQAQARITSAVASGSDAYRCTNVGCRLSLGNTSRYLVDDGTNLEFVAPVQATSFEATNATANAALLSGGSATNALFLQSNATDAFTSPAGGLNAAFVLKSTQDLTDSDNVFTVTNYADLPILYVDELGNTSARGRVNAGPGGEFSTSSLVPLTLAGRQTDSATSVGIIIKNNSSYTTAGAKVASFRNATTEVASIDKDGAYTGLSCNATATSGSSFTGGNATGNLTMTSNATDAVTSSTVPAIRLQASQNITDLDLLLSVEDSAGNRRLTVNELGDLGGVRDMSISRYFTSSFSAVFTGLFARAPNSITIPDNGAGTPAAYSWQPSVFNSVTFFTCNDANGCDITLDETNKGNGEFNRAINIGTNTITFTDTAGVTEMAGNFTAGQYDTIEFIYASSRFVEVGRSDN